MYARSDTMPMQSLATSTHEDGMKMARPKGDSKMADFLVADPSQYIIIQLQGHLRKIVSFLNLSRHIGLNPPPRVSIS